MTDQATTAYCVKCKTKQEMSNPQAVYTAAATPGTRGVCSVCGTRMFRMGRTPAHEGLPKPEPKPRPKKTKKATKAKSKTRSKTKTPRRRGKLVIVESPAKARTIGKYLGKGYTVKASVGHVRDLLRSQLSVDVEHDFAPKYRVPNEKRPLVKELTQDAAKATEIYLATDADREGEAIAWHLMEAAQMDPERTRRVAFHEITKDAIAQAFASPRDIDMDRVNAQQARRILDRLVGYKISPLLWRRVRGRTSAGRVQSVALRLICERENAINDFTPEEYWTIKAKLGKNAAKPKTKAQEFMARLLKIDGQQAKVNTAAQAEAITAALKTQTYKVTQVKRGKRRRKPAAPFTTSTLQQEASRRLGFGTRKTMRVAQQLYEGVEISGGEPVGLITYMRTDSTNVAAQAQNEARSLIVQRYGAEFVPQTPPVYKIKARSAQEAHEAIRPTDVQRAPSEVKEFLSRDQYRLYNLVWLRFIASQMSEALYETMRVDIIAGLYSLRASGSRLKFSGFLTLYEETADEDATPDEDAGVILPDLSEDEIVELLALLPEQHFTQPPPRFTEASLIKTLEEFGIGRPSTYAPTIGTIQDRGYVERAEKRLYSTELGTIVNNLLVEYFPDIVDVEFTARMEADLDKVAWQGEDWVSALERFWKSFERDLQNAEANMPEVKVADIAIGEACPKCEHDLVVKYGRYGKFIACSNFPDCRYTRPFTRKIGVACPKCGKEIVERKTQKGRIFYGCETYPDCDWTSWKRPLPTPCPACSGLLTVKNKKFAQCTECEGLFELDSLPVEM